MSKRFPLLAQQRGDAGVFALAAGAMLFLAALFLGLGDLLGAMAVRAQAENALVTSVRAAARQFDRAAWVQQHQIRLDSSVVQSVFNATLDANIGQGGLIEAAIGRKVSTSAPVVTGEIWVPVRTINLGLPLQFHLKYSATVSLSP